nr:MAG TPA: hypothetical protein [Caudoviricetes sp.]DAK02103.1 MAG TPA: hypothetical protein [Caudoviricetes sp.]
MAEEKSLSYFFKIRTTYSLNTFCNGSVRK